MSPDRRTLEIEQARTHFPLFAKAVRPELTLSAFHLKYYRVLHLFAAGKIRRLIVTIPPQHGKSEGSTRLLPAYLLGLRPDERVAIASYSDTFARKFNRDVQRLMDSPVYRELFPGSALYRPGEKTGTVVPLRNSGEFELIDRRGSLKAVGRGGSLTGNRVDTMILDDLYSNSMEGNSPVVREAVWEWYTSVAETRLHNDSQLLIVFTRWHENDLIGRLEERDVVEELSSFRQIRSDFSGWYKLNFEALKESEPTELDPRQPGEPLWPERHSAKRLTKRRALDGHSFECMYQGHPAAAGGLLYAEGFGVYDTLPSPDDIVRKGNYTDTADLGEDYLCSVCYALGKDGCLYVTDVLFTQESMERTEPATADMLVRNGTRIASIESNNGGRGFARAVGRLAPLTRISWFHQSGNKEARILTNSATVLKFIKMPADWAARWPGFYHNLTTYKKRFRANRSHDAADVLTGMVEIELLSNKNKIKAIGFVN